MFLRLLASELWEDAKSQTDVLLAAENILAALTFLPDADHSEKQELRQKNKMKITQRM